MAEFIAVAPEDVPNLRDSRRGRVSYPLCKMFLESNLPVAQLDRTGIKQSEQSLRSCITSYVRSHDLPIKVFSRGGKMYFARLDMNVDSEGNVTKNENWREDSKVGADGNVPTLSANTATPINPEEVAARFEKEKGAITK